MENSIIAIKLGLLLFAIIVVYELIKFFARIVMNSIRTIKTIRKNDKTFLEMTRNMEDMKSRGEMHEWMEMEIPGRGELTVCRKTGWAPSIESFYPIESIRRYEKSKQIREETERELKKFKQKRLDEISQEYSVSLDRMDDLAEEIYKIKKDFHIKKMAEEIGKLKEAADEQT